VPSHPQQRPHRGVAPLLGSGAKMSAREYEQWRDDRTWDPSRQPGPVLQNDLAPADWIEPRLPDWESPVSVLLFLGFAAYARIFREYHEETADERHERVTEALSEPMPGADRDEQVAHSAFLPDNDFEALLPALARHTSSLSSWFLLWDGHGNLNDSAFGQAPKVRHPIRDLYLLRGPHAAYQNLPDDPNYWWPADQAWCICADTDWDYYYVAGTLPCIEDILRACDRQ
jgi:hypothetical protein